MLAAPVVNRPRADAGVQLVENEVLPQRAQVIASELVPASVVADEAGVEAARFGSRDDLGGAAPSERADEVNRLLRARDCCYGRT